MNISNNFCNFKKKLPKEVLLVVVTKNQSLDNIIEVYNSDHKDFGENRVQELCSKQSLLPKDINWHMIGHLQTNKVKYIASFISLIHSVDSLKLLLEINKQAKQHNRTIKCLLQFYIAKEETKFGLTLNEAMNLLESEDFKNLENIVICGVMGMASFVNDKVQVSAEFVELRNIFEFLKQKYFVDSDSFTTISMGMSDDYECAIDTGSNLLRIGSLIFK